jgi:hypothetical protein
MSRSSGTLYLHLHRTSEPDRNAVRRKIAAYHLHIQLGLIAQGLLQHLAIKHSRQVWVSFGSWLRTIRPGLCPSELVFAAALRNALPEYLADSANRSQLQNSYALASIPCFPSPCASPDRQNPLSAPLRDSLGARNGPSGRPPKPPEKSVLSSPFLSYEQLNC